MSEELLNSITNRIWENNQFKTDYDQLHFQSINKTLMGDLGDPLLSEESLFKLIQSASFLASSINPNHRHAAYRIAVDSFILFNNKLPYLHKLLHIILGKLGNFPAIHHLYRLIDQDKNYQLPSEILFELLWHEKQNTIKITDTDLLLTDFQIKLWKAFISEAIVSVSAPTSAGKSFALQQFLISVQVKDNCQFSLYIVPSRALIHQVSDSIKEEMRKLKKNFFVSVIPQPLEELKVEKGAFVLTQERAQILLEINPALKFDLVIIDEAQTIGEGDRGILLQIVIEKLLLRSHKTKFIFGSPFSKNPDFFSFLLGSQLKSIKENTSPVTQNLICLDINELQSNKLNISLLQEGKIAPLSSIVLKHELNEEETLFAYLCVYFGKNSKSIVYAGSPSKCEDVANYIKQWIEENDPQYTVAEDLKEFANLVREHIHKDYNLAKFIERGIVFHYGKMPTILRKAIEYYYSYSNELKFLVCTSTMLYGVNYPAKNIFIMKPSEGEKWLAKNADPMRSTSFWNLAGRAGRLGKDFEGNVFLINKSRWNSDPTEGEKEQTIKSSLFNVIKEKADILLNLTEENHSNSDSVVESTFVKLYCDLKKGKLQQMLEKSPVEIPYDFVQKFSDKCEKLAFGIPDSIIENNYGISPFYQKKMFDYIIESIQKEDYQKLIPSHPESSNNYTSYVRLFSRFEKYFEGREKATKQSQRLAAISLDWMRGIPYPIIIKKGQEYNPKQSIQTIIRNTMETIENTLRFKYVRYSQCYNDLLNFALEENQLYDLVSSIPAIPLYLEIGACSGTMINLIGLGLSRTTAGILNSKAANRTMNREECIKWLKKQEWENSGLPKVSIKEIYSILT